MIAWWAGGLLAVGATWFDVRCRTIPHGLVALGALGAVGAMAAGLVPWSFWLWAIGLAMLYTLALPAAAFGGGDLKLATVSGLWWGPAAALMLLGSHLLQFLYTAVANRRHRRRWLAPLPLPWAPFLAAAWLGCTVIVLH